MATFVLIHGSWHGGWCFDGVRARLEAAGHHVTAPDLPGMGGTKEELQAVTLAGWGEFVAALCRDAPQRPVVLAGHSRGGMVISEAAERAPGSVDALVYICAVMLPDGMSRADFKALEGPVPGFDEMIIPVHDGAATLADPTIAPAVLAQLSPPGAVEAAMARLVAEPYAPRATKQTLSAERWGSIPRIYIECTQDRTIPLSSQRMMQSLAPGARVVSLDADHAPYLSRPDELTDALLAVAASPSG